MHSDPDSRIGTLTAHSDFDRNLVGMALVQLKQPRPHSDQGLLRYRNLDQIGSGKCQEGTHSD